ncbi:hypothetical protein DL767_006191 [Monosporascus sp. MG133]|nr:hypothetical protein DL767_006191 [Monosporascus sp. MG133]
MISQTSSPRRKVDRRALGRDTPPRYASQRLSDFILFPDEGRGTGSDDDVLGESWGNKTASRSPTNPIRRHQPRIPGTQHNSLGRSTQGIMALAPAAVDDLGARGQWNSRHSTESKPHVPPPPSTPRIPRLPTPEFDDPVPHNGSLFSHRFCACCPSEGGDAALSRWREGRAKMDKQTSDARAYIAGTLRDKRFDGRVKDSRRDH